jgi:hypothetical protein
VIASRLTEAVRPTAGRCVNEKVRKGVSDKEREKERERKRERERERK